MIVNAEMEIVQFRGQTGSYLQPAPGKASLNLLKMAREGLLHHRSKSTRPPPTAKASKSAAQSEG